MQEPIVKLDFEALFKLKDEDPIKEGDLITVIDQENNVKIKAEVINLMPNGKFDLLIRD